ncbi:MAG: peptidylprolyl isomerase [Opitutales bacterium]
MSVIRHLSFHYTLRQAGGAVLDTSRGGEPLDCVEGAGQIIEGLEDVLRSMQPGESRRVVVPPERGYGLREESLVQKVPRAALPVEEIRVGDRFQTGPDPADPVVTVLAIEAGEVTLDANHPLAGQPLHFEVELVAARAATGEEQQAAGLGPKGAGR